MDSNLDKAKVTIWLGAHEDKAIKIFEKDSTLKGSNDQNTIVWTEPLALIEVKKKDPAEEISGSFFLRVVQTPNCEEYRIRKTTSGSNEFDGKFFMQDCQAIIQKESGDDATTIEVINSDIDVNIFRVSHHFHLPSPF